MARQENKSEIWTVCSTSGCYQSYMTPA